MVKIVAHYHTQFYDFPEDNPWWVKGHTDWAMVRGGRPWFKTHDQPRCPLDGRYYRLDDANTLKWQARLALEYGIYGFCFQHYWYKGKTFWEKPAELFHRDRSLKLRYCLAWDNNPMPKAVYYQDQTASMTLDYGKASDWQRHFSYAARFFEDPRYITIAKKPVFLIHDSSDFPEAGQFLENWNALAAKRGFPGICFIRMLSHYPLDRRPLPFNAKLYCEPGYTIRHALGPPEKDPSIELCRDAASPRDGINDIHCPDYDAIYQAVLRRPVGKDELEIPGVFTDWDDSPRKHHGATICRGSTPAKFEGYLLQQIERSLTQFDTRFIFVNAWNAWADGAFLEPDTRYGSAYLEAVKGAKNRSYGLDLPLFYRTIF